MSISHFRRDDLKKPGKDKDKKKKKHKMYFNSKGVEVPSVTNIIKIINDGDFLIYWANNLGLDGIKYWEASSYYSGVGTLTHSLIESKLTGEKKYNLKKYSDEQLRDASRAFKAFKKWKSFNVVKYKKLEEELVSDEFDFGGTIDFYGSINGKMTVLDFKTSSDFSIKMFFQLAGYVIMEEEYGRKVDQVGILKLSRDDATYDEKYISRENLEPFIEFFKKILKIYKEYEGMKSVYKNA